MSTFGSYILTILMACLAVIVLRIGTTGIRAAIEEHRRPVRGRIVAADGTVLAESGPSRRNSRSGRRYPLGPAASHFIGTVHEGAGLTGVERRHDERLARGEDVVVTIDARLQRDLHETLLAATRQLGYEWAGAVVIDPNSGDLLGSVLAPGFDPRLRPGVDPRWDDNRLFYDLLEPGSTIKPLLVAAALETGTVSADEVLLPPGERPTSFGALRDRAMSLDQLLAHSSRWATLEVADRLGEETTAEWFARLGLVGDDGDAVLPGGRVSFEYGLEPAVMGQSVVTPALRLLASHCALVNGGLRCTPRWTRSTPATTTEAERVISSETSLALRRMLLAVTEYGTATSVRNERWPIIGKTGTVTRRPRIAQSDPKRLVWFVGFAPAHEPRIGLLIVIQSRDSLHYTGGDVAADLSSRVFERLAPFL